METSFVEPLVTVGVLLLLGYGGVAALRRAQRRRREQIEGSGEARPKLDQRRRPALAPEADTDEAPATRQPADEEPPSLPRPDIPLAPRAAPGPLAEPRPVAPSRAKPERPAEPTAPARVLPFRPVAPAPAAPPPVPPAGAAAAPAPPEPLAGKKTTQKKRDAAALAPGLARTRAGWVARLGQIFTGRKEIEPALIDDIERVLLTADIGVRTSQKLLEEMRSSLSRKELADPEAVWASLRRRSTEILSFDAAPVSFHADGGGPFVLLVIGVNGSGKTTTIGKLASILAGQGKKVVLGAGDTFRAAASEQLEIWAGRAGVPIVRGKEGADPSSVLFEAVKHARDANLDVVIADTAGRLHTKTDLMDELQKVRRVIGKAQPGAPHETWLVIDSTQGQNAIAQAQVFTESLQVTGIVLTKLDGTAKGGVILGIADQLRIPVRYIGVGERVEDLRAFDAEEFVEALYAYSDDEKT